FGGAQRVRHGVRPSEVQHRLDVVWVFLDCLLHVFREAVDRYSLDLDKGVLPVRGRREYGERHEGGSEAERRHRDSSDFEVTQEGSSGSSHLIFATEDGTI